METDVDGHRSFPPNEFFGDENKIARFRESGERSHFHCSRLLPRPIRVTQSRYGARESNREEEKPEEGTRIVHRVAIIDSDLYFYSPFTYAEATTTTTTTTTTTPEKRPDGRRYCSGAEVSLRD